MVSADSPDPLIGTTIGDRWRVVRRIGQGGMGTIYEVAHARLPRSFALKTLAPGLACSPSAQARFRREAETVASLRHPNIVEIVDWDALPNGSPCLIMELLRGEDLGARLRRLGPLPWPAIRRIGDELLAALAVAHRAGVVHRDLKPGNIFLAVDDAGVERVKVLDFGISKVRDAERALTTDQALGTPLYMSPEQADRSPELGPEADTWALGAILYEMATGQPAFAAKSAPAVLYRICHGRPDPLAAARPDAPASFVALVERALTRDPECRIFDVDELRRGLAAMDETEAPPAAPRRRSIRWALLAAALLAAGGAATGASWVAARRPRTPAATSFVERDVRPTESPATPRAAAPPAGPTTPLPAPTARREPSATRTIASSTTLGATTVAPAKPTKTTAPPLPRLKPPGGAHVPPSPAAPPAAATHPAEAPATEPPPPLAP